MMTSSHPAPRAEGPTRFSLGTVPPQPRAVVEIGTDVVAVLRLARRAPPEAALPEPRRDGPALTEAERDVMHAIFEGKSNEAIARERGRSARTVANQIASIFRKHGVGSRSELVAQYMAVRA